MGKEKREGRQGDEVNPPSVFELHHQASDSNANLVAGWNQYAKGRVVEGSAHCRTLWDWPMYGMDEKTKIYYRSYISKYIDLLTTN